jgi:hypothetical protein
VETQKMRASGSKRSTEKGKGIRIRRSSQYLSIQVALHDWSTVYDCIQDAMRIRATDHLVFVIRTECLQQDV